MLTGCLIFFITPEQVAFLNGHEGLIKKFFVIVSLKDAMKN